MEERPADDQLQAVLVVDAVLGKLKAGTRFRAFARHASFVDGVDLFDNKLFGLSLAETKGREQFSVSWFLGDCWVT